MPAEPSVAVLVPRRAGNERRERLWGFVADWWAANHPGWPVIEGHHDDGPFNRAAAVNTAAAQAGDADVLIVADGDVVVDAGQVRAAVDLAHRTGRAAFAYTDYCALTEAMTGRVLSGHNGSWARGVALRMRDGAHVSSCVAVPRRLWDTVAGLDPRFVGWGHEDVAFFHACRVLGGGIERVPGTVWHLWHPTGDAKAAMHDPAYLAGQALKARYIDAWQPAAMRTLIAHRADPRAVALVVLTDGRRDAITRGLPSALEQLKGAPIPRVLIHDDSGDPEYAAWLRLEFDALGDRLEVHAGGRRRGYAHAVTNARRLALGTGLPWAFWLEDDFVFERPVDLAAMQAVLDTRPHLVQMALRRQAWFPGELAVGGVVELNPAGYSDETNGADCWLEHREFWTANPHLARRADLVPPWPTGTSSEHAYGRRVLDDQHLSAYWGSRDDDPWVTHIGVRSGHGH